MLDLHPLNDVIPAMSVWPAALAFPAHAATGSIIEVSAHAGGAAVVDMGYGVGTGLGVETGLGVGTGGMMLAQAINGPPVVMIVLGILGLALIIGLAIGLIVPVARAVGWIVQRVVGFIGGEIGDLFRLIGAVFTAAVFVPITLVNVLIGRWSAAGHYGRSIQNELGSCVACLYRMLIGHPARLVGLEGMLEGIEERVPQAVAAAPGPDRPSRRTGQFDGYSIVGSLQGGGSGGKLYIAQPDAIRRASFERAGQFGVGQVVIKSFSLRDGSSLPQIVRESRALEAAKKLGLVLDHEMTNERFFYVMRYVPGQSLSLVMQGLHTASPSSGLNAAGVRSAMTYAADLLKTLDTYHRGGLWHKDVKPDNIIVDGDHAHLVDFGLLTHLSSSMTLTTHGTEYFRDPELVRMALRGVKVHEVDGAKFDIYAAGAVIYAMIENSFPAHGALSQITRNCPEALRWIVRRAMTEYDKRYATAAQMLLDLETVRSAADPFAVTPAMLPSMRAGLNAEEASTPVDPFIGQAAGLGAGLGAGMGVGAAASVAGGVGAAGAGYAAAAATAEAAFNGVGGGAQAHAPFHGRGNARAGSPSPRLRVVNWWTGKYESDAVPHGAFASPVPPAPPAAPWPPPPAPAPVHERVRPAPGERAPAHEQVRRARERAQAARDRVQNRMHRRRSPNTGQVAGPNRGVVVAVTLLVGVVAYSYFQASESDVRRVRIAGDRSYAIGRVSDIPPPTDPRETHEAEAKREHEAEVAEMAREAAMAQAEAERENLEEQADQLREELDRLRDQKDRIEEVSEQARESADTAGAEARAAHAAAVEGYEAAIGQLEAKFKDVQSALEQIERERDSIDVTARGKVAELEAIEAAKIAESRASRDKLRAYPGQNSTDGFKTFNEDFAKGFADAEAEFKAAMKEGFGKSFSDAFGVSPRGRLAVYVDLAKPFSQEQTRIVTGLIDRLLAAGFTITGDFPTIPNADDPAHAAEVAKSVQVSAELLRARGAYGTDSKEARAAIASWLAKDGTLDAAVLLVPVKGRNLGSSGPSSGAGGEASRVVKEFSFVIVAPEASSLSPERREHVNEVVEASVKALSGRQER